MKDQIKCNKLIELYPSLYGDPDPKGRCKHSMQMFGFEVEDGWYDLLKKLSDKLIKSLKETPLEGFYVQQVKEKFGELRFYTNTFNNEILNLIREAETEANRTCEYCGSQENVKRRGGGWIKTLCDECHNKRK